MSPHSLSASLLLACCLAGSGPAFAFDRAAVPLPLGKGPPDPIPVIEVCRCSGTVFERGPSGLTTRERVQDVTDPFVASTPPRDSCSSGSRLAISWSVGGGPVLGWVYGLNPVSSSSPTFVTADKGARSASFDLAGLAAGNYVFTLRAIGPKAKVVTVTRWFALDLAPDTWWAGPDPNSPSLFTKPNGDRYAPFGFQSPTIQGSLLSPDSVAVFPALRSERKTFLEIWKDTVFVRQEGDTVHLNSWVVLHNGGFDSDSPYAVLVTDFARTLPGYVPEGPAPVLVPGPANGSATGFRTNLMMSLTPAGQSMRLAFSYIYPVFDPTSFVALPRIGGYWASFHAGRVFAIAQAEDGDGVKDLRVPDPRALVLAVEAGTATPNERALRSKVLTYEVDKAPWFVTDNPIFAPIPQQVFVTRQWPLRLVATDEDPFLPVSFTPPGGPSPVLVLRRRVRVHGQDASGNPFTYVDPLTYTNQQDIMLTVPEALAPGPCTIEVELCDCQLCEDVVGSGRCVTRSFPVLYQPPGAAAAQVASIDAPRATVLLAPYPNPAPGRVVLRFELARPGRAEVEVFSLTGARVRRIVSESLPAGAYAHTWNGESDRGERVAEGLYFVRMRAGEVTATRKVLMSR